jgi:hypothetical protein
LLGHEACSRPKSAGRSAGRSRRQAAESRRTAGAIAAAARERA